MKWRVFLIVWAIVLFSAGFAWRFFYHLYTYSTIEARLLGCTVFPESHEYYNCLREVLKDKVNSVTIPQVLQMIPRVTKKTQDPSGLFSCHNIAHVVGDLASRGDDDTASLVAACGNSCKYGCVHAVIFGRVQADPTFLDHPEDICTYGLQKAQDVANCYHGLGHVFAEYYGYDMTQALARCDIISKDRFQEDCAGGIFMEVFQPPLLNHPAQAPPTSPLAFCSTMPQKYKQYCVIDYAILQYQNTQNIQEGIAYCNSLSAAGAERCGEVLGHAVYEHSYGQSDLILQTCARAGDLTRWCLIGTVEESLKFDQSGRRTQLLCDVLSREGLTLCEEVLQEVGGRQ